MKSALALPAVSDVGARPPAFTRTRLMSEIAPGLSPTFQRISARSSSSSSLVIHGTSAPRLAALGVDALLYITGLCVPVRPLRVRGVGAGNVLVVRRRSG